MIKTLLVGINAKFIHSNLAIRSLKEYAKQHYRIPIQISEYTINQRVEWILSEIYKQSPDIIGFSCYIWNYEMIKHLVCELKKVLPNTVIFLGGPEVSYSAKQVLLDTPADAVIMGEGEQVCAQLIDAIIHHHPLEQIHGITYRTKQQIIENPPANLLPMADIPFVYQDMTDFKHRIVYYESSRGCPFHCQYCLSCNDNQVRFRPLEQVFEHLNFFLTHHVRQVKFVDRTFNCKKSYAMAIWRYLQAHDNGYTNFHFEIAAELLDEEMLSFFPSVRKGLFQFEIGVQSTNPLTLKHIQRNTQIEKLRTIIRRLQNGNIHLHLDLIIGLPYEDYQRFSQSFNDVYALAPDQLQVGFLKLLKGSGLYEKQTQYGIVCSDYAPYEVLYTSHLSYLDILKLKMIEEMVEIYYNSNRFIQTIRYLVSLFPSPFAMFEALATFYEQQQYHCCSHSNVEYYSILYKFFQTLSPTDTTSFQWLAKFDLYSHEKAKKLPEWLTVSNHEHLREEIYQFYHNKQQIETYLPEYAHLDSKQIYRQAHIEQFPFHPITGEQTDTIILFNYQNCDLLGNATYFVLDSLIERSDVDE